MSLPRLTLIVVVAVATALAPGAARAGIELVTEGTVERGPQAAGVAGSLVKQGAPPGTRGGAAADAGKPRKGRVLIDGERVRIEGAQGQGASASEMVLVFRPDREAVWVIDAKDRAYFELSPTTAKETRAMVDEARSKMQEALAQMPPERRAMFEQTLKAQGEGPLGLGGAGGAADAPREPITAKPNGASDTVSGFACRGFDVRRGAEKVAEVCVASWGDAGLAKGDLDGLRKLAVFQRDVLADFGLRGLGGETRNDPFAALDQLDGLPVRIRTVRDGAVVSETRVVKVERLGLEPTLFEPPAGYVRKSPAAR